MEQERLEVISRAREEGQRELRRVKQEAAQALLEFKELLKDKEKLLNGMRLKKKDKNQANPGPSSWGGDGSP